MPVCMVIMQKGKTQCLHFRSLKTQSREEYLVAFMSDIKIICILPCRHSELNYAELFKTYVLDFSDYSEASLKTPTFQQNLLPYFFSLYSI